MPQLTHQHWQPHLIVRVIGAVHRQGSLTQRSPWQINGEWWVQVRFPEGNQTLRCSSLELLDEPADPRTDARQGNWQGRDTLQRLLAHEKLQGRLTDLIYSMETSDTDFLPYQFKPVLKFLESPSNSLLIADEVGLGKTIEAGLIWMELRARVGARSLLVLCPPHLREKWRLELERRFGVRAEFCDAKKLAEEFVSLRRNPGHTCHLIGSFHGLRPPRGWREGAEGPRGELARMLDAMTDDENLLDLLVIDEAHYLRNPERRTHDLGQLLCAVAAHRVFLSATPLHTSSENLFQLLRLLDPDTFGSNFAFSQLLEANAPLVRLRAALLDRHAAESDILALLAQAEASPLLRGSQVLAGIREALRGDPDSWRQPQRRSELAFQVERVNLLAHTFTRTRKKEALAERQVVREVTAYRYKHSLQERETYELITRLIWSYAATRNLPSGFLEVMPLRMAASSLAASVQWWLERDSHDNDDRPWDDGGKVNDREGAGDSWGTLTSHLRDGLRGKVTPEELEMHDSKYVCLEQKLRDYWRNNPGCKVVLFSTFKPTLRYLKRRLAKDDIETELLIGGQREPKQDTVDRFRESADKLLLLSSEVGSEGLDIQVARTLVNYDLPWNPMVVEQRIGRLDRIGQEADQILILNLLAEGTIDERIYERLYERLDLFKRSIGDLPEIVGKFVTELHLCLINHELTPEQKIEVQGDLEQALADQFVTQQQLEQNAAIFAHYGDYLVEKIGARHRAQGWVKTEDIRNYIRGYFQQHRPAVVLRETDGAVHEFELALDADTHHEFDRYLNANHLQGRTQLCTRQIRRLRFDHRSYTQSGGNVEVVTQAHPLVRFVASRLREEALVAEAPVALRLAAEDAPEGVARGVYAFIVQRWEVRGLRENVALHARVTRLEDGCEIDDLALCLSLLERAATTGGDWLSVASEISDVEVILQIEEVLQQIGHEAFASHEEQCRQENADRVRIQRHALDQHEHRRLSSLNETLARHQHAKRVNLVAATEGRIAHLRERCDLQRRQLEEKGQTVGSFAGVAFGVISVE